MLDFYRAHGISPVRQDITDLSAHFARRAALYRSVGLTPGNVNEKTVLEVGPGSGENARYIASLRPARYVLLEPNATGRADVEASLGSRGVRVVGETIQGYEDEGVFEVVLCEGLLGLSGAESAESILRQSASRVAHGGILLITTIDAISDCAEVLRRAFAYRITKGHGTLAEQVERLRPIFAPHLATLKGMTRSVDDWILDNLLNPASIGPTFSIPEAIRALGDEFAVLGSSPRFLTDWRWYKDYQPGNQWAIDCYWSHCHNLFDYRKVAQAHTREWNEALMDRCLKIRDEVRTLEQGGPDEVTYTLDTFDPGWFGRGQQYLSFVRL